MAEDGARRRRPKPGGAVAPATARWTDSSPRGSGGRGEGAGGLRRLGETRGRGGSGWGGSWRRRRRAPPSAARHELRRAIDGVPGQERDGRVRVKQCGVTERAREGRKEREEATAWRCRVVVYLGSSSTATSNRGLAAAALPFLAAYCEWGVEGSRREGLWWCVEQWGSGRFK